MKLTKEKAIELIVHMADYIKVADIHFSGLRIQVHDGVVSAVIHEEGEDMHREWIAAGTRKIADITEFISTFTGLYTLTGCVADAITLNSMDDWNWVINTSRYGRIYVRYASGFSVNSFQNQKELEEMGFKRQFMPGMVKSVSVDC